MDGFLCRRTAADLPWGSKAPYPAAQRLFLVSLLCYRKGLAWLILSSVPSMLAHCGDHGRLKKGATTMLCQVCNWFGRLCRLSSLWFTSPTIAWQSVEVQPIQALHHRGPRGASAAAAVAAALRSWRRRRRQRRRAYLSSEHATTEPCALFSGTAALLSRSALLMRWEAPG